MPFFIDDPAQRSHYDQPLSHPVLRKATSEVWRVGGGGVLFSVNADRGYLLFDTYRIHPRPRHKGIGEVSARENRRRRRCKYRHAIQAIGRSPSWYERDDIWSPVNNPENPQGPA